MQVEEIKDNKLLRQFETKTDCGPKDIFNKTLCK